jgi:uncharacterized protein
MTEIETRTTPMPVECRLASRGSSRSIGGYALTFGGEADLGGFIERIAPSFCDRTRAKNFANVIARYNHDSSLVLGSVDNGTLRCNADNRGLDYTVEVPEWPGPPYVLDMVSRGDVRHSSFSFTTGPDDDEWDYRDGRAMRTLLNGTIFEVAPVPIPAYSTGTSVAVRSLAHHKGVPYEDVVQLVQSRDLARLFTRSDPQPAKTKLGRQALIETLAMEYPEVGAVADAARRRRELAEMRSAPEPLTGKQAMLEVMRLRWPESA